MASVTNQVFSCDNGLATVSLTYDDVTLAFQYVDMVNNRTSDLVFTITDTATSTAWTYTLRTGRTAHRQVSGNYGYVLVTDPDTGLQEKSLGTLVISVQSRVA